MESELQAFLDDVVDTLVKLEIVLFFNGNPGTMDTSQGIAMRIYRNKELTAQALEDLCSKGVLEALSLRGGTHRLFSLSANTETRRLIRLLDERYHGDRIAMVEIVRRFIPKKTPSVPNGGTTRSAP
jgi:hypothetical protein